MNLVDQAVEQAKAIADAAQRAEDGPSVQKVPITPVPTLVGLGQSEMPRMVPDPENEGKPKTVRERHVVLSFSTPSGEQHYFLPPEQAEAFADALKQAAVATKTGMWLPGQDPSE